MAVLSHGLQPHAPGRESPPCRVEPSCCSRRSRAAGRTCSSRACHPRKRPQVTLRGVASAAGQELDPRASARRLDWHQRPCRTWLGGWAGWRGGRSQARLPWCPTPAGRSPAEPGEAGPRVTRLSCPPAGCSSQWGKSARKSRFHCDSSAVSQLSAGRSAPRGSLQDRGHRRADHELVWSLRQPRGPRPGPLAGRLPAAPAGGAGHSVRP